MYNPSLEPSRTDPNISKTSRLKFLETPAPLEHISLDLSKEPPAPLERTSLELWSAGGLPRSVAGCFDVSVCFFGCLPICRKVGDRASWLGALKCVLEKELLSRVLLKELLKKVIENRFV